MENTVSETSTQTDDATQTEYDEDLDAANMFDNECDSDTDNKFDDDPPPYTYNTSTGEEDPVKSCLPSESKKSPPNKESLDDLKLAIEKSNIDCNERLESLEKSVKSGIEQQGKTGKALMDLQDTVYAYFKTNKEDVTTSLQEDERSSVSKSKLKTAMDSNRKKSFDEDVNTLDNVTENCNDENKHENTTRDKDKLQTYFQIDFGTENPFEFPTEHICDLSNISSCSDVYKFGAISGLTKGTVRMEGSSVRCSILKDTYMGVDVVLHQQIEIVGDKTFAYRGDSGSLVLKKENNQLAAVGLFEGKMENIYMVTPIVDIKQELCKALSLNRDPPSQIEMDIDDDNFNMAMKLYYVPTNVYSMQQAVVTDNISAEISRQTRDLQINIMHSTDHKVNTVKTELTAIKEHIDNTKNEIKKDIKDMEGRVTENINDQITKLMNFLSQGKS